MFNAAAIPGMIEPGEQTMLTQLAGEAVPKGVIVEFAVGYQAPAMRANRGLEPRDGGVDGQVSRVGQAGPPGPCKLRPSDLGDSLRDPLPPQSRQFAQVADHILPANLYWPAVFAVDSDWFSHDKATIS